MKLKNVLLTGSTGKLGGAIRTSELHSIAFTPTRQELDLTHPHQVHRYLEAHPVDAVIHCAAMARMAECEKNPRQALEINTVGTAHLVSAVLKKEESTGKPIRFIHISTDGVYSGSRGDYREQDETIPYNVYGWTKLGAECAVKCLSSFCIVRTSFFDPNHIPFEDSATDAFSSKVPLDYLVKSLAFLLNHPYVGMINIGSDRKSDYERYKAFKPSMKPCSREDILKHVTFNMARDASMDCGLWERLLSEANGERDR